MSAISAAARGGVLVKGGAFMEALSKVKVFAFDKTGTLTRGQPVVTDIFAAGVPGGEDELLRLAASVEKGSEHPLGEALVA